MHTEHIKYDYNQDFYNTISDSVKEERINTDEFKV